MTDAGLLGLEWDARVLEAMLAALDDPSEVDDLELARFRRLQRDYPQRGGKGIRGRLVALSALAHGADLDEAASVAAALELFQNWVLVHDDVEDDSETRRGKPAMHRSVGIPVAINVGDAMHVAMWRLVVHATSVSHPAVLTEFLDMISRTAEGQHLDLAWVEARRFDVDEADYLAMVERKTAYYTVVSPLRLGAHLAGTTPDPRFTTSGLALGAAFQIRDDVLNLLPDDDGAYGKEFAGDLLEGKRTLVLAHAFATLDDTDARRLEQLLDRPRNDKSEASMQEALRLLEQAGSIEYAQSVAEAKAEAGLAELDAALASLPRQDAAREVLQIVRTLAARAA